MIFRLFLERAEPQMSEALRDARAAVFVGIAERAVWREGDLTERRIVGVAASQIAKPRATLLATEHSDDSICLAS